MVERGFTVEASTAQRSVDTSALEMITNEVSPTLEREPTATLVERWAVRGAAFVFPLVFLPNVVSEFVLPKLLLLRLLIFGFAVLLLVRWFRQGAITWRRTPLDIPLIVFVASAAISTVFAINRNLALFGGYSRWEGLLTITSYALLFWLTVQMLSGQADARGLTWSLLISGYFVAAVAILQSGFGLLGGGYWREAGVIRADVTLAHPDFAGIFLAMLIPVAAAKIVSRRPSTSRLLAANMLIVLVLGLITTFSRAAWIGAIVGVVVVLALRRGQFHVRPPLIAAAVVVAGLILAVGVAGTRSQVAQGDFAHALLSRIASIPDVASGSEAIRIQTWRDTLPLIATRPIFGWGPDNFGLAYPRYQSTSRHGEFFDKPHMEVLGVTASQGLIGLAAYIWILISIVRAFWRGRFVRGAVAVFGGLVAYQVSIQADFSWIPTAVPFWLLAAGAIVTWAPRVEPVRIALAVPRRTAGLAVAAGSAALAALLVPAVVNPYLADASYYAAPAAPDLQHAQASIAAARQDAPYEATYAIEAGNYALNLDQKGNPAPNADWQAARAAYEDAARLGSFSPEMFQLLAVVDEHLGDHPAAVIAARRALELDRFDPTSQKLVKALSGLSS